MKLVAIKLAEYQHRKHDRPGRLYGCTPTLVGPRTYTQAGMHRWRIRAKALQPLDPERNEHPANQATIDLTNPVGYRQAVAIAQRITSELVDETPHCIDQHFELFVLIPESKARAKANKKARARR